MKTTVKEKLDIMDIKLEKIADNVANVEPRCLCWNIKFFCIAIVQSYFLFYHHTTAYHRKR